MLSRPTVICLGRYSTNLEIKRKNLYLPCMRSISLLCKRERNRRSLQRIQSPLRFKEESEPMRKIIFYTVTTKSPAQAGELHFYFVPKPRLLIRIPFNVYQMPTKQIWC